MSNGKKETILGATADKVANVKLRSAVFVPTVTEFQRTLNSEFYFGLEMELHFAGVRAFYQGKTFIIPYSQCEAIVLA